MEFTFDKFNPQVFDTETDLGFFDSSQFDPSKYSSVFSLDARPITDQSYGGSDGGSGSSASNAIGSLGKIFEALDKANTYKQQGSTRSSKMGATPGTDIQQIGRSTYLVTPPPKKIPVGTQQPSGGSGLFGSIGGAAGALGTAAGVFGPLGAPIGALVGKGIDSIFG